MSLFRHGFTSVRRSRGLSLTIIATLGIALAAAVLVFTFLNSFLLRPLPYGDTSRLVVVYEYSLKGGKENFSRLTYGNVIAVQERTTAFARSGVFRNESATFQNGPATETAFVQRVTAEVFPMLGARAALGSVITPANVMVGGIRSVVLSDALWRRRFGADPAVIGRTIQLDADPHHVVGVMGPEFVMPTGDDNPQAWPALLRTDYLPNERTQRRHHLWAELAPGRTLATAGAELGALARSLSAEFPLENADRGLLAMSLRENLLGGFDRQLLLLQGAVGLVLVVACFNCLCLLIARALQRRREFAVRLAVGASRRDLLAQLFAESLWLSIPAAITALGLAALALPHGIELIPVNAQATLRSLPRPQLDATVAITVVATAIVIALAFSIVPLLQTRRLNLETALREGGRSVGSPGATLAARLLASGQIAVALALLISAALLLRSQRNLTMIDPGFPLAEFDQFRVGLRGETYRDPARRLQFFERLRDTLRTLPGVRDVGVASFIFTQPPIGYQGWIQEGDGLQMAESPKRALPCFVLPNIFATLGLRLVEGRWLDDNDVAGRPAVAVINAALAAKYFPGESALGRRVRLESARNEWVEIVGVVSDVLGTGNQPRVLDTFYLAIAQLPPPGLGISFLVRHGGVAPDARSLERALAQVDPNMQFFGHISPAEIYAAGAWQTRFVSRLVAAFAFLAIALALAGIYAVNSFFVTRRVHEFGIRVALGATAENIVGLVVRDSLRLTLAGLVAGVLLAIAASRGIASLLYAVPGIDPLVYAGATLAMTGACVGATLLPARRAAKVDPLGALRSD